MQISSILDIFFSASLKFTLASRTIVKNKQKKNQIAMNVLWKSRAFYQAASCNAMCQVYSLRINLKVKIGF